ncbi:4'-phosphopantetheinyl transferase family protein [Neisseria wadsworthii]|uniref:4'-phosphopantetheinyl transferase family protein n=1 Tax=Neisseria wadsworthii TaxID=607711 RepID=UPI000D2FDF69|nr:4'-phosphopantetheinyl transferase superfamily protein [Neisseria wadsworthii]
MPDTPLTCLLADGSCADLYRPDLLDKQDALRLQARPALAQRADWRVSRYLRQQAVSPVRSLSHSKGMAAVLCGGAGLAAGVDIEYIRPREFASLAEWVAQPHEQMELAARGWQADDFYELWTLKEALLKAGGLGFPEAMKAVGRQPGAGGKTGLHVQGRGGWRGVTYKIDRHFMLACVWLGEGELELRLEGGFEADVVRVGKYD